MTTTHVPDTQRYYRPGTPDRAPAAVLVDAVSGPHTIVGLGEDCFVCFDPLEPGEVYLFVSGDGRNGVAHESCVDSLCGV